MSGPLNFEKHTRIQPIPLRNDRCQLCQLLMPCHCFDHDLRGPICGDVNQSGSCAHSVMLAELLLRALAHCAPPIHSILEDHA